ncbi:MAG: hypothetical protein R3D58_23075 [Saprospiraceae bacterium]
MRTLFFVFALFFLAPATSRACDRCGCSLSGHYLSALPQYQRHVLGVRWFYRSFETEHHGDGISSDRFHSAEIWGRFYPARRLQVLAVLPYNHFTKELNAEPLVRQGIGDAVLLANYNFLEKTWGANAGWRHALYLGGGVKLPTGKFDPELIERNINPNLQPGTGALDWLASGTYTLRFNNWGLNTNALFRMSGKNSAQFQFGNRLNLNGRLFYLAQNARSSWLPSVGLAYEWATEDSHENRRVDDTGGYATFGTLGLDWYPGNLALSVQWDVPLDQFLGDGYVDAGQRFQVGLSYLF